MLVKLTLACNLLCLLAIIKSLKKKPSPEIVPLRTNSGCTRYHLSEAAGGHMRRPIISHTEALVDASKQAGIAPTVEQGTILRLKEDRQI